MHSESFQDTESGNQLVMKPTGFMTKAQCIAEELGEECDGSHRHVKLLNRRASRAEVYPDELCFRILGGLIEQMKRDRRIQDGGLLAVMEEEEMENQELMQKSWDDVTGEELDIEGVKRHRKDEIQGIHRFKVYDKVPIKES